METFFIPNENDFRRWIKDAIKSCFDELPKAPITGAATDEQELLNRKEVASLFRISLVTLHDWMNRGLPFHKQRGRVYFVKSEVLDYVKKNKKPTFG